MINNNNTKPTIIFVLGGPGSGKGTQCQRIVEEFGYAHLSAGDLLREERDRGSETAQLIESILKDGGKIVPSEITVKLLRKAMEKNGWEKKTFLIDGFPRNEENLRVWTSELGDKVNLKFVLYFECSEELMTQRVLKRGEVSGRCDDNIEVLKKRFQIYIDQTKPIIEHFQTLNQVVSVNTKHSIEEVHSLIKPHLLKD